MDDVSEDADFIRGIEAMKKAISETTVPDDVAESIRQQVAAILLRKKEEEK